MKHKIFLVFAGGIVALIIFFNSRLGKSLFNQPTKYSKICPDCNIIFVSFDTLRAKNVHFLGYSKNTTPVLDGIAAKGVVFTNAMSVTTWTLPSTMSLFTGMYPSRHKVLNKFTGIEQNEGVIANLKKLSPEVQTLAQVLRKNGYQTGGFTGGAGVHHQFGFDQGFDIYTDKVDFAGLKTTAPQALSWIKEHKKDKFFVFLHGYDVHGQYVPEEGYDYRFVDFKYKGRYTGAKSEQESLREQGLDLGKVYLTQDDVRFFIALYDEKIQRADANFGDFLSQYSKLGLNEKTLFVLTSDHGEEFYEHGLLDHGQSLYEELTHVPMLIHLPKMNLGRKVDNLVRSIDLMPTILELVGITPDSVLKKQIEGISLVPIIEEKETSELTGFSETDYRYTTKQKAIKTPDNFKLIFNLDTKSEELFNLSKDPDESINISKVNKSKTNSLMLELKKLFGF